MTTATETLMLTEARKALAFIQSKSPAEIKQAVAERNAYVGACLHFNRGVSPSEMGLWSQSELAQILLCDMNAENAMDAYDYEQYETDEELIIETLDTAVGLIDC